MRRKSIVILLILLCGLSFYSCFVLNRYIYTDRELKTHYATKTVQPVYNRSAFLDMTIHYALVSRCDTLPLLVLLHGAPGAWYGYMNLMEDSALQRHFQIVAIDRPGYGKSNYGKAELSTFNQALAVQQVITACNTSGKPVSLLGRSYGAPIAAHYALYHPQNVDQLIMVSPVIDPDKEKFYWFSPIGKWKIVQWFLPKVLNVATREKYAHPAEMRKMETNWRKLYVPTTVLTGENDWIADTANYTFAQKHIINAPARFYKLKNTGHLITYEQPELIKRILLKQF